MQRQPFVVGLTGGIASGKSTVAAFFQNLKIDVIDTDQLAREVVEPGQPALASIVEHFGQAILQKKGRLDRVALKKIIFDNLAEKEYLENLLHPLIRKQILKKLRKVQSEY
jgi:dephospho-CoA kinase